MAVSFFTFLLPPIKMKNFNICSLKIDNFLAKYLDFGSVWQCHFSHVKHTYTGAGSPSASHSIMKGLSFSSARDLTWKSNSSVGGCLIIRGGLWTETKKRKKSYDENRLDRV